MKKPLVSILLPVHNAGRYIEPAIKGILAQTYTNFELLIANDGSTDISSEILSRYAHQDKRIKVNIQQNQGLTKTLINLAGIAQGSIFARHDADDISNPDRLEKQVSFLSNNPQIAFIGSATSIIDEHGAVKAVNTVPISLKKIHRAYPYHNPFVHPTLCIRREAYESVGGYRVAFVCAQDYDLICRMLDKYDGTNIAKPLYSFRLHKASVSVTRQNEQAHLGALASFFTHERANYGTDSYCNNIATKSINEITKHTDLVYIYYLYLYHYYGFKKSIPKTVRYLLKSMPQALWTSDFYTYPFYRLHKRINDKLLFKRMYE